MCFRRVADQRGSWTGSVTEIETRTGIARTTVKQLRQRAEKLGLLRWQVGARVARDRNEENSYELCGLLDPARSRSDYPDESRTVTGRGVGADLRPAKGDSPNPSSKILSTSGRSKSRAANKGMSGPIPPLPPSDYAIAMAAKAVTEADRSIPLPRTAAEVWSGVERIREILLPLLSTGLWRWTVKCRGWEAGLAVLETAILSKAGHVRDPGGYFWGIVKPGSDCAPAVTIGRILGHRRAPGMTSMRRANSPTA